MTAKRMKALTMMRPQSHGGRRSSREIIRLDCNEILSHVKSRMLSVPSAIAFADFWAVRPLPDYSASGIAGRKIASNLPSNLNEIRR